MIRKEYDKNWPEDHQLAHASVAHGGTFTISTIFGRAPVIKALSSLPKDKDYSPSTKTAHNVPTKQGFN